MPTLRDWLAGLFAGRKRPARPTPKPAPTPAPKPTPVPPMPPAPADPDVLAALVAAHNAARQAKADGLAPLTPSARLAAAAGRHATAMAAARSMSHQLPQEADLGTRLRAAGYSYRAVAENIAESYPDVSSVMAA